jgi:uncharacterized membrane protein
VPDIGVFHPQIVHFVVALCVVGVLCRLIAFRGKPMFLNGVATLLIVLGALASVAAARSGDDAHGPVERIPGANTAVTNHEEWGERTRNVFLGVAALELLALAFMKKEKIAGWVRLGALAGGLVGAVFLYEAAEHGGELVYSYAGGVGTRSGEPEDVTRLLIAGLHNKANLERSQNRPEEAARLVEEMARQAPMNPYVQLAYVRSLLTDRHDANAARGRMAALQFPESLELQRGTLLADVYRALGTPDSAVLVLEPLAQKYPQSARVRALLDSLRRSP